jgi:hypothetical protein
MESEYVEMARITGSHLSDEMVDEKDSDKREDAQSNPYPSAASKLANEPGDGEQHTGQHHDAKKKFHMRSAA